MTEGKTRVGLMGFGRIGRNVFRQLESHPRIEVAAIADIADPKALVYLLKYDSVFGRFPKKVALDDAGNLTVGGRAIPMLQAKDPGDVDWAAYGVDVVVQATRKHRTAADCRKHLDRGAKRVVLASTPEDPADMDTLLMGVNDEVLGPEDTIIALGSNTSNAVAPVLKVLMEHFGVDVKRGFVCYTRSNNYVAEIDFQQKDYEKAKEIVREILNIIQKGYFPEGTKQKARCVDCTYRNICV